MEPLFLNNSTFEFRTILARPGDSNNTKLIIRLVAGAWCVATFVLTNIYSNLLISYVTSPNPKPMLSSINDLANRPEIHVAVDTGYEYYIDPIVLGCILLITKTCFKILLYYTY